MLKVILTAPALSVSITLIARQALAHHCPEGQRLHHTALSIVPTVLGCAKVLALVINAGHTRDAIQILGTGGIPWFISQTSECWVTLIAWRTEANSAVVLSPAGGICGTAGVQASLNTVSILAGSVVWAVIVSTTPQVLALDIWIAFQTSWATTLCLVVG